MKLDIDVVEIDKPENTNLILGQSHFIKTVEDLYEAMTNAGGGIRFGLAFLEASGPCLIRHAGNDETLRRLAVRNAKALSTGHAFIVLMEGGFPINVLNNIKMVPEVCNIYCATANRVQVLVAGTPEGRGILGVIDGNPPSGVEQDGDARDRHTLLRKIGYKL